MDKKSKSFGLGGYRGRIIFLGDGTEVLTDSDDTAMFDNAEEDRDLEAQVSKGSAATESSEEEAGNSSAQKSDEEKKEAAPKSQDDTPASSETKPEAEKPKEAAEAEAESNTKGAED